MAGEIRFAWELWKIEFKAAMEYRVNFIAQTVAMVINNAFWLFFWFLIFQRFGAINGWEYEQIVYLYAMLAGVVGIYWVFVQRTSKISTTIEEGGLDRYLCTPKNIITQSTINIKYAGVGDILTSIILLILVQGTISSKLLAILFIITGAIIFFGWGLIFESLAFYVQRFSRAAQVARELPSLIGSYPFSVHSGMGRIILTFIIPTGLMVGVPVDAVGANKWSFLLVTSVFAIIFVFIGIMVFYSGLKKYESGNVMGMRS